MQDSTLKKKISFQERPSFSNVGVWHSLTPRSPNHNVIDSIFSVQTAQIPPVGSQLLRNSGRHYGPNSGYHGMAGRDASRSFSTGNFKDDAVPGGRTFKDRRFLDMTYTYVYMTVYMIIYIYILYMDIFFYLLYRINYCSIVCFCIHF